MFIRYENVGREKLSSSGILVKDLGTWGLNSFLNMFQKGQKKTKTIHGSLLINNTKI